MPKNTATPEASVVATQASERRRGNDSARAAARRAVETPYRITDYPMHYFAAIQRQNQLNLARALRDIGVSVPMWRALSALRHKDGQTIGELAQLTVLDRSSLGRLLDEMARDRLVEREPLPDDRRALLVSLSAKGHRTFEQALAIARRHYREVYKGITPEEFEMLMRVLQRIKANTRAMADVADLESLP
jgi:MarR family transcriptional regulator, organic hydroperoxide resistance regulator